MNKTLKYIVLLAIACFVGKASAQELKSEVFSLLNLDYPGLEKVKAACKELEAKMGAVAIEQGQAFLEENKKGPGVVVLPSGLQYEIIKEGTGKKPKATDQVRCHYEGTLIDGTLFDSSIQRGEPAVFGVNQVIPGWVEALQLMPEGSKWKLYIPSELGYGARGAGEMIPPHSTLIFEVELLEVL